MTFALLLLAAAGHAFLWAGIVNRLHGTATQRTMREFLSHVCLLAAIVLPVAVAAVLWRDLRAAQPATLDSFTNVAWTYLWLCAIACVVASVNVVRYRLHPERRGALLSNHTTRLHPTPNVQHIASSRRFVAPGIPSLLARLPGNQAVDIHIHEKELAIPRLPAAQDGLRIAHFSDLHMSGRITKKYFEVIADAVNGTQPDLVALTGDIVDRAECIDWIPETLGRLRAPLGVYYVRGNHDRRVDHAQLTKALADAGLIHLGGQWRQLTVRDLPLIVAGNELPWHEPRPAPGGLAAEKKVSGTFSCPKFTRRAEAAEQEKVADTWFGTALRILLTHSPDQFRWAQEHEFDLVLAGHNHGGQVCLPLLGPILTPSLHGTRYAAGVFRAGETVLHVTRGVSGLTPLRYNCPPEVAVLILRPAA